MKLPIALDQVVIKTAYLKVGYETQGPSPSPSQDLNLNLNFRFFHN